MGLPFCVFVRVGCIPKECSCSLPLIFQCLDIGVLIINFYVVHSGIIVWFFFTWENYFPWICSILPSIATAFVRNSAFLLPCFFSLLPLKAKPKTQSALATDMMSHSSCVNKGLRFYSDSSKEPRVPWGVEGRDRIWCTDESRLEIQSDLLCCCRRKWFVTDFM